MFDFTPIHRSFGKLDLTDTGEDSKVRVETCLQAKTSKSGHAILLSVFRRVRATSMPQRRVEKYSRPLLDVFACEGMIKI